MKTLTFAAGVESMTISVPVLGDTRDEIDEQFFVNLTSATFGQITDSLGIGTIQDDDGNNGPPDISISDAVVVEGDNGATDAVFTLAFPTLLRTNQYSRS